MWKASWGLPQWVTHYIPTLTKITFDAIKHAFLAQKWNYFHLTRKKLDYLHLKNFVNYACESYLKQLLTPPQHKILPHLNHILVIEIGRRSISLISRDTNFALKLQMKMRHTFVLWCPLYNSIRDRFSFLFQNVSLGSLESFFQLDHQVDISLYLIKATALCYSTLEN